jgi:hypothetical protein
VDLSQGIIYIEGDDIIKSEQASVIPLSKVAKKVMRRQKGKHPTMLVTYKSKSVRQANIGSFKKA